MELIPFFKIWVKFIVFDLGFFPWEIFDYRFSFSSNNWTVEISYLILFSFVNYVFKNFSISYRFSTCWHAVVHNNLLFSIESVPSILISVFFTCNFIDLAPLSFLVSLTMVFFYLFIFNLKVAILTLVSFIPFLFFFSILFISALIYIIYIFFLLLTFVQFVLSSISYGVEFSHLFDIFLAS